MNGPYWTDGQITLWHGDCRENTAWLNADVLICDVPYGMNLRSGMGGHQGDLRIVGDNDTAVRDAILQMWGGDRPALIFGRWSVPRPPATRMVLTWEKGEHVGMGNLDLPWKPNTEEIYVLGKWPPRTIGRTTSVLRHLAIAGTVRGAHGGRNHETEKPVGLMAALIDASPPGAIADPTCGSGPTLVAAKAAGRNAVGVEILERHARTAARRLTQGTLNLGDPA